jgi:hypothetical protein
VIQGKNFHRSRRAVFSGVQISLAALAFTIPAQVWAQCSPDPTQANAAVTCSGNDTNGITVTTSNSPLTVTSGASVTNTGAGAITVSIPATSGYTQRSTSIIVNGSVTASGGAGIAVTSGAAYGSTYDFAGTYARITIAQGGAVSGSTGIALTQTAGIWSASAPVTATIDNAGTITGSGGIAISTGNSYATVNTITNRATGTIGAIAANYGTIGNDGTIEGAGLSAINQTSTAANSSIGNTGTIHNTAAAATITSPAGSSYYVLSTITNTGTIANGGSGAAISTGNQAAINNNAGGTIASNGATAIASSYALTLNNAGTITNGSNGGAVVSGALVSLTNAKTGIINAAAGSSAISASSALTLTNAGTINGDVVSTSTSTGARVDSTAGTINGNVTLGAANDTLVANYVNGALVTGVTGAIDGGGGTNTLLANVSADTALTNAVALPTNFTVFDANIASGVTLTLNNGFAVSNGLGVDGPGSLVNNAALTGTVQIGAQGYSLASFVNNGSVTASGTGVYDLNGKSLNNTGTIRSTGGIGLVLTETNGTPNRTNTNSGTITGATAGASLYASSLVNAGTISGATGVLLDVNSVIVNAAGGTINGTTAAISAAGNSYVLSVVNAGTINGNVNLVVTSPAYYGSYNNYWAQTGGVLNGNLSLGSGDTLITNISGAGTSGYAGINGTVSASNSALRYDVTSNASDTLTSHAGFTTLGYQVASGATLTLGTSGTFGSTLNLAGQGTIVFDGSIATTNTTTVNTVGVLQPGISNLPNSTYTLVNNGSLTTTRTSNTTSPGATVYLPYANDIINNGSIAYIDPFKGAGTFSAIYTAGAVTNTGTITSSGYGINATGVTNSGTISAANYAVLVGSGAITNSGTITSTATAAIGDTSSYGTNYTLTNLAGGVITGLGTAIQTIGGTVSNAGTINGNVNLGYPNSTYNARTGIYIANGGVLNGNLTFGSGTDFLVETGSGYGVTGTIDAGAGTNRIGHQRTGTATVTLGGALPTGFTGEFTLASGASSQVTLTGPSGYSSSLYVGGDGTIINQLATSGGVYGMSEIGYTPYATTEMAGFFNRANVGSVSLTTSAFDNSATIGSTSLTGNAVALTTSKGFTFSNSGTIANRGALPAVWLAGTTTDSSTIANSGTINGGISASITAAAGTSVGIVNSGTITGYTSTSYVFDPVTYIPTLVTSSYALLASVSGAQSLSLANSGIMSGDISLSGSDVTLVSSGTITGNITTGAGNDSIAMNGAFAGGVDGGAGTNTLSIGGGTQSAPVAFTSVSNIATLTQTGGFATVSGTGTFGVATLTGGRLVGLAGSVLNASSFNVGANATFGSAGTVNGNVIVNGTLSPGASPGTMTVNGNVTLGGGSTSLFEITPTVSDKLIVNGKLVIQSGSTLQIAATGPVKVGSTLDLITASEGISGSYTSVTGLAGTVRTLANGDLGLLVQFANPASYSPQLRNAITYVNNAMVAASAPAALLPALSALQDANGAPIASAFARLTPEPYADAMQIGTETALSLAGTARSIGDGETGGPTHLFGFGQMLGSMRQFASNEEQGVSHATINGFGALGGLGVAGRTYAVSAYVGWMDQSQSIAALGASTKSRGVVGGFAARFGGATQITLSANYDAAHALTRRMVPDVGTISTAYALPSWSFDASLSHAVPLGGRWLLRPRMGTTWVVTSHDAITEASMHPFALNVDKADLTQGFVDAGLGFETAPDAKGPWRRFLTLGVRYRAQGDQATATAALAGYTSGLTALGVGRNRVDATMAAGVDYRLAPGASLFLNASGELGKEGKRESVTAGLRFRL